jgi:hypothetical protein
MAKSILKRKSLTIIKKQWFKRNPVEVKREDLLPESQWQKTNRLLDEAHFRNGQYARLFQVLENRFPSELHDALHEFQKLTEPITKKE